MNPQTQQSPTLRYTIRKKRRHLLKIKQHQYSHSISQRIIHSRLYKYSRHIALYLSSDGEVDLSPLINHLHGHNKTAYLPVILSRKNSLMYFAPFKKHTRLQRNCFGILEPVYQKKQLRTARQLDLILAPLVGFDEFGNRMGMGGGYYDRALQHLNNRPFNCCKTKYIGIAYELQKVQALKCHHWDIPLHGIFTEKQIIYFKKSMVKNLKAE